MTRQNRGMSATARKFWQDLRAGGVIQAVAGGPVNRAGGAWLVVLLTILIAGIFLRGWDRVAAIAGAVLVVALYLRIRATLRDGT
jgi:hypothetical protein